MPSAAFCVRRFALRLRLPSFAAALLGGAVGVSGQHGTDMPASRPSFSESSRPIERLPVFFPPYPPPLGRIVARGAAAGAQLPAPPELAAYVSEFFYPALGSRLATRSLSERLRAQLDAFRAAKLALQDELRAELARIKALEPAERTGALAAFSRRQTPKIVQLEKHAEQLRRDLVSSDLDWSALRQWRLSDRPRRGYSPFEIAQVMRSYAFYHAHLLPAQRRLLREISIELAFAAESAAAATAAQPYVFFPPEPARVMFPDDVPAALATKLAAYQTKKSALKKELYDAVCAADGASFTFLRGSPLKALAEKQAAPLAELDVLAEEIRRELSSAPEPRLARSPLPAALESRVAELIRAYLATQREASAQVDAILARAKGLPLQASYRFEGDALRFLVAPTRGGGAGPGGSLAQVEAVRAEISAVADEYGRRMADLHHDRESIRRDLGPALGLAQPEEIERVLLTAMRLATEKETESTFHDYRIAVFEPGLSPEQRRLLFGGVMERLEMPLPRGELQPTTRADTW